MTLGTRSAVGRVLTHRAAERILSPGEGEDRRLARSIPAPAHGESQRRVHLIEYVFIHLSSRRVTDSESGGTTKDRPHQALGYRSPAQYRAQKTKEVA
jgi:hypothetical protein